MKFKTILQSAKQAVTNRVTKLLKPGHHVLWAPYAVPYLHQLPSNLAAVRLQTTCKSTPSRTTTTLWVIKNVPLYFRHYSDIFWVTVMLFVPMELYHPLHITCHKAVTAGKLSAVQDDCGRTLQSTRCTQCFSMAPIPWTVWWSNV